MQTHYVKQRRGTVVFVLMTGPGYRATNHTFQVVLETYPKDDGETSQSPYYIVIDVLRNSIENVKVSKMLLDYPEFRGCLGYKPKTYFPPC